MEDYKLKFKILENILPADLVRNVLAYAREFCKKIKKAGETIIKLKLRRDKHFSKYIVRGK